MNTLVPFDYNLLTTHSMNTLVPIKDEDDWKSTTERILSVP